MKWQEIVIAALEMAKDQVHEIGPAAIGLDEVSSEEINEVIDAHISRLTEVIEMLGEDYK